MKHRSILSKTTGVGAMIRLMGYIHVRFLNDEIRQGLQKSNDYFYEPYINKVENVLSALKINLRVCFHLKGISVELVVKVLNLPYIIECVKS